MVLRKDHPFNPGEHKFSMLLPIGGMILLGLTCLTAGFVFWPDPKPHYDTTMEGTPAPATVTPDPPAPATVTPDPPAPPSAPAGEAADAATPSAGTPRDAGAR